MHFYDCVLAKIDTFGSKDTKNKECACQKKCIFNSNASSRGLFQPGPFLSFVCIIGNFKEYREWALVVLTAISFWISMPLQNAFCKFLPLWGCLYIKQSVVCAFIVQHGSQLGLPVDRRERRGEVKGRELYCHTCFLTWKESFGDMAFIFFTTFTEILKEEEKTYLHT